MSEGWEPLVVAFRGKVFGMDPTTGRRIWCWEARMSLTEPLRLAVDQGRLYVLANSLACLDLRTGEMQWQTEDQGWRGETLLARDGLIVVGAKGEASAYNAHGQLLWHEKFKGQGVGRVSLAFRGAAAQGDRIA